MEWRRQVTLMLCLLGVTATAAWSSSREVAPSRTHEVMESHIKSLQENRQKLHLLKNLLEDLDMNMEAVHDKALERAKRCVNTGGDDCANGYFPDAGSDGGYFGSDNTPGKRATFDTLSPTAFHKVWLRCLNTGGDDCANGYFPDAGTDGGYFGSGSTPGKRATLHTLSPKKFLRSSCLNTGGDDCINNPNAGIDDNYFGGGGTPGKRATLGTLSPTALHRVWLRCLNTGGDDCANGYFPDAGTDGGYFGSGSTPGKRSLPHFNAKGLCQLFPMSPACRNE